MKKLLLVAVLLSAFTAVAQVARPERPERPSPFRSPYDSPTGETYRRFQAAENTMSSGFYWLDKAIENRNFAEYEFGEFKKVLKEGYDSLLKNSRGLIGEAEKMASDKLSKRFESEAQINIGDIVPLGVGEETATSITMSTLATRWKQETGISWFYGPKFCVLFVCFSMPVWGVDTSRQN